MVPEHIFRAYDIRGEAARDLASPLVRRIGRSLADRLPEGGGAPPRIAVARDCRMSGPRLHDALVAGLVAGGAQVLDLGVGPTPLLYFGVHHLDADGGVMITGSHNKAPDNGFKILRGRSSFFGEALQQVARDVAGAPPPSLPGGTVADTPVDDAYVQSLIEGIDLDGQGLRVVIDAGNGAAGPLALRALEAAGVDPVALFCDMDGTFPNHHPDPTVPDNLATLIAAVREHGAHVGLAWDGDGDRLGVVDADGSIVWGDRLLALFARDVLDRHPGAAVIGEVKCSQRAFDDIAAHGGRPIVWKTGHSLIKAKMKQEGALLAGEMSGHFFFADRHPGYDDGIYAALRLLEILAREQATVGELLADLPRDIGTPEIRRPCPDAIKFEVVDRVRAVLRQRHEVNEIDGVRVRYDDGAWALVRASNTGPVIVLRFEAPTEDRLQAIRDEVEAVVADARQAAGG